MRRYALIILILIALLLLGPAAFRYLNFYGVGGGGEVAEPPAYDPSGVIDEVPLPPTGDFFTPVDSEETSLAIEVTDGIVLIDQAHDNNFTLDEITILTGYLADRGLEVRPYRSGDSLVSLLRGASSFVSMVPLEPFDQAEVAALGERVVA